MPESPLGGVQRQKKPLKRGFCWGDIEKKIGRQDLNPRPHYPKVVHTKLRYARQEVITRHVALCSSA